MDFKATSINVGAVPSNRRGGFALVELLVAIGITALLLGALSSVALFSGRSFAAMANYVDLDSHNQIAMDMLTRDLREGIRVKAATANQLTLVAGDGSDVVYTYSPGARTLIRSKNGADRLVLSECEVFSFSLGQRNPIGGSYDVYPAATPATAKVVNVAWTCSRSILGVKQNTESVQTARIVIRKQGS